MVTPTDPDVPAVAQALLELCVVALGGEAPTRKYRSAGLPAWDFTGQPKCDSQLVVVVGPMAPGIAGTPTTGRPEYSPNRLRGYTFTIELARSVPTQGPNGTAPTMAVLDAAGAQHLADYQTLDSWVRSLGWSSKEIPVSLLEAGVKSIVAGQVLTVAPSGGMVGIRAVITVTV